MNAIIITMIMLGGMAALVAVIENCRPLWKWIEKQQWWKEIVER